MELLQVSWLLIVEILSLTCGAVILLLSFLPGLWNKTQRFFYGATAALCAATWFAFAGALENSSMFIAALLGLGASLVNLGYAVVSR